MATYTIAFDGRPARTAAQDRARGAAAERGRGVKIHTEPRVLCIARTRFDRPAMQPYLDAIGAPDWSTDAPGGDAVCEAAGRVCYRSFASPRPGGNAAYMERILSEGHGSVVEHWSATLLLTGISRSCCNELIRHRHLSFSMRSQRYCDDSEIGFVVPPARARVETCGTWPHRIGGPC